MIQNGVYAEEAALLATAQEMCVAARTAPKTKGEDFIVTCIVSGEEKEALAKEMERLSPELGFGFFCRDAVNIRDSFAVVLIGVKNQIRGMNAGCQYCGFADCQANIEAGAVCAYGPIDLGIAVGSAAAVASDRRVDSRVMFSAGRAAMSLGLLGEDVAEVLGLPIAATGKSPYFDRKSKK